jgi:hypothetical protein
LIKKIQFEYEDKFFDLFRCFTSKIWNSYYFHVSEINSFLLNFIGINISEFFELKEGTFIDINFHRRFKMISLKKRLDKKDTIWIQWYIFWSFSMLHFKNLKLYYFHVSEINSFFIIDFLLSHFNFNFFNFPWESEDLLCEYLCNLMILIH